MHNEILVSAQRLNELIQAGQCIVVDCRFDFSDSSQGRADWLKAHIPGAAYAHMNDDLAAPITEESGRHPLPDIDAFAGFLASLGWTPDCLLVAYDSGSNALSGRLWWLMRFFGQPAALLDGGLAAWNAAGLPLESGPVQAGAAPVAELKGDESMIASSAKIRANISSGQFMVMDARAPERFSGRAETLDTKAGHIPGSLNRPFQLNLADDLSFKKPQELRSEYQSLLDGMESGQVIHTCGSGVTACHNLFSMELAGLDASLLFPGSWSEWIRDPSRPIESGE